MKKIVKLNLISLIIIIMIFCIIKSSYATLSSKVTIISASEVQKGEEFAVKFNLSNLQSDKGINALMGTLKYDEDSLALVKMEGQNSWSNPSYNEANGAFVMDRDEYVTTDGAFMEVTFKVKDESKQNVNISIEKISLANDEEEVEVSSTSKSITVKGSAQTSDTNTNSTTNNSTNSSLNLTPVNSSTISSKNNSVQNGTLPNTGRTNTTPIIVIAICAVIMTGVIVRLEAFQNK